MLSWNLSCCHGDDVSVGVFSDIDECKEHNGGCQYKCINSKGGYKCNCPKGQRLHADQRSCVGEFDVTLTSIAVAPHCSPSTL